MISFACVCERAHGMVNAMLAGRAVEGNSYLLGDQKREGQGGRKQGRGTPLHIMETGRSEGAILINSPALT